MVRKTVDEAIKKLRAAWTGKEVRDRMADTIEAINDEVIDTTSKQEKLNTKFNDLIINAGNSNAEVATARKGHATVGDRLDEFDSQLDTKMNIDDKIKVSQIDKNKGKFDQTYFTDEFLQQMVGNTPVNAVPADGGVTTEKLANESVTFEKVSDKSALTSLNPYNLFNNSLLKQEVGGWQLNKNASFYDEVIKIDGFNTIRVVKDEGNVQNNHFYQSKKDLKDKTQYVVLAEVYCEKASRVRIQWYRYKDNVYVDSLPSEHYLNVGRNIISATFTTDYTVASEYRIAFGLSNY